MGRLRIHVRNVVKLSPSAVLRQRYVCGYSRVFVFQSVRWGRLLCRFEYDLCIFLGCQLRSNV